MAQFFIDRPIFAWVISLFILVLGGVAIKQLPIAQYPSVAPPSIVVTAVYPGASAQTLENTVISVIEQAETPSGIVVPQQAVQRGSTGDSVMVVAADGKVAPRPVKVSTAQAGQWIVLDGLKPGEMVMVDGFQKLRGPAPVKPVPWQPGASAPASAASGASRS